MKFRLSIIHTIAYMLAWLPLAVLLVNYFTGQLSPNPIQDITLRTGRTAIVLLLATLACTPLRSLLNLKSFLLIRRGLGLLTFLYASLHFLNYLILDFGLDLSIVVPLIFRQPFLITGLLALLLLIPLAITSTQTSVRRLGKSWSKLHRFVYLVAFLAGLHYFLAVKRDVTLPLLYTVSYLLLMLMRLKPFSCMTIKSQGLIRIDQFLSRIVIRG